MRIYELAQLKDVPSKIIIETLQNAGFDVKSHMSVLDDEAIALIDKEFGGVMQHHNNHDEDRSMQNNTKENFTLSNNQEVAVPDVVETHSIFVEQMSVDEFAQKAKKPVTDVLVNLLKWGIIATKNQVIGRDIVTRLAQHYELSILKTAIENKVEKKAAVKAPVSSEAMLKVRHPVIVVVGHVDHGKTTLLDYIRNTRVALKEKGGITQHLGAYEVTIPQGTITFLDTPGHEAFSKIRQRGVKAADIVILVVAADDGIMPQTVEAIKHSQAMNVPIIVALNKIDKVDQARVEVIKGQLSQYGLVAEDWGGETICLPISAKFGTGVDQLLDMVALQAELMELRADVKCAATGYVLESRIEKGRGPVATIISQNGTLRLGDYFICEKTTGHISSIVNSYGKRLQTLAPSVPALVAGFDNLPEAGDFFEVVSKSEYLKVRGGDKNLQLLVGRRALHEGGINLLVKADTHSSLEAIIDGLDRLSKTVPKGFNILRHDIGDVNESDVEFAFNTGAQIIGFNIKVETNAFVLAARRKVTIDVYAIIYKLLESLEKKSESLKEIKMVRTKIGEASVLRIFDIKKIGIIAGCIVKDGRFVRNSFAVIWRGRSKIGEGKILSLQRDKRTVKEVFAGFECGFLVEGITDWQIDDRVECYIDEPKP